MKQLSRRSFLGRAAATAGALSFPAIVPARVLGRNAPSHRVTFAAIGAGGRAGALTPNFMRHADVQYLAVCDCFRTRREAMCGDLNRHYGTDVVKPYADFREVMAREDIDAVVVATPDHWHVPVAIAAARAGKDMYVEKPLGVSLRWAQILRDEARRHGCVFQYGTQQRSGAQFLLACELVRHGAIGEISRVEAWCAHLDGPGGSTAPIPVPPDLDYEMYTGPAPMRPYTADRCTSSGTYHCYDFALGFIAGWGAHPLDIAQWGLGTDHTSPVLYEGTGQIPETGLFDTTMRWDIRCRYADGIVLEFMDATTARPRITYRTWCDHGTTFHGPGGWISVGRDSIYASDPALLRATIPAGGVRLIRSAAQDRNLVDAIKTRGPTISPLESAIRSDTISHLSDLVVRTGRAIRWDPEKEQILGDEAASRMLWRPLRAPWAL
jgi:hypothetical protein